MPESSIPLAVLPLIFGVLIMAARFYARDGAISVLRPSFLCATFAVSLLVAYMILIVVGLLPPYAWVGFGGVGVLISLLGIWSLFR